MLDGWPSQLKIEVKTSRDGKHHLSERDLEGIRPDGYAAILIGDRLCRGPRWILVPARLLSAGGFDEPTLCQLGEGTLAGLCEKINLVWSDWILDDAVWRRLFEQRPMGLREALDWCLENHPPRHNQSTGNLREGRLADALLRFRDSLDRFVGGNGAQEEGFVHQRILGHTLRQLGYRLTSNPIGVPDISGIWEGMGDTSGVENLRRRILDWTPESEELMKVRSQLLDSSDQTLSALSCLFSENQRRE